MDVLLLLFEIFPWSLVILGFFFLNMSGLTLPEMVDLLLKDDILYGLLVRGVLPDATVISCVIVPCELNVVDVMKRANRLFPLHLRFPCRVSPGRLDI